MLCLLLYIDDIEHVVKHSSMTFFADDLSLYLQVSSFAEWFDAMISLLSGTLSSTLEVWSCKCQQQASPITFGYFIGSHTVMLSQKVKYLQGRSQKKKCLLRQIVMNISWSKKIKAGHTESLMHGKFKFKNRVSKTFRKHYYCHGYKNVKAYQFSLQFRSCKCQDELHEP